MHGFVDLNSGTESECEADGKTQQDLSAELYCWLEAVFPLFESLDVVIGESDDAEDERSGNHQDGVDTVETANEEHGDEDGRDDDDTAHGGDPFLLGVVGINGFIALRFNDFLAFQHFDEVVSKPYRDDERQDDGYSCAKSDVVENPRSGEVAFFQIVEQIVQHDLFLL